MNEECKNENVKRRRLRDSSNPLELPENVLLSHKQGIFLWILDKIGPNSKSSHIPMSIQLAATMRFFAEGGCQRSVGNDAFIAIHRTTFSKILTEMLTLLEQILCQYWIKLPSEPQDILKSKNIFFEKYRIPGIVGCMDVTHIKVVKSVAQDHLYFNRKGYYSINTMIICDYGMNIVAVHATRPGSSNDSFVWNLSAQKDFYRIRYENGERGSWLLADSGYALEPFVLTPYRTPGARFTNRYRIVIIVLRKGTYLLVQKLVKWNMTS